ncbi:hypothetical protein ACWAT4_21700 [Bradyrhizobium manausense]
MMNTARFKIDFMHGSYEPFGLFWRRPGIFGVWVKLDSFKTRADAKEHYEKIKDLPEYLP